jgi:hypothetical protein
MLPPISEHPGLILRRDAHPRVVDGDLDRSVAAPDDVATLRFGPNGHLQECVRPPPRCITRRVRGVTRMTAAVRSRWWSGVPPDAMLPPRNANGGHQMYKLLSDLGQAVVWIWMTPEEARQLLRQRDVAPEARDARSDYATAA